MGVKLSHHVLSPPFPRIPPSPILPCLTLPLPPIPSRPLPSPPLPFPTTSSPLLSGSFCTKFGQLIIRKIIKTVATRCQILMLKCTKIHFRLGFRPRPRWGSLQRSPRQLDLRGPTSKGRGGDGNVKPNRKSNDTYHSGLNVRNFDPASLPHDVNPTDGCTGPCFT